MNFNPASVVAAAAAAAHSAPYTTHHHHHSHHSHHPLLHSHIIPLPSYSSQPAIVVGVGGSGGGSGGGGADSGGDGGGGSGASAGDSSPKIMEWTNDDALELIEQYRCHTELWNRADPKYKDKLCRFRAWSEIAERFGCSKAEVERKMNVLLTQYRREKHKMFVKIYQGIQPNPSKWYAFKRFDFMEAGGGSLSGVVVGGSSGAGNGSGVGGGSSGPNIVTNPVSTSSHNGLNGLAAAAVAAAAYENSTIAAAANGGAPIGIGGVGATNPATSTQQQQQPAIHSRRMKTKELKYFGAMGLSIPMLIAGGQTLDSWNTTGQYSPPIGGGSGGSGGGGGGGSATGSDRGGSSSQQQQQQQQLRVPLPMTYGNAASTPYPGGSGGGGGGSSSSEFQPSPHKTMDTSDNEDTSIKEDAAAAAALGHLEAKVERRSPINNNIERIGGGTTGDAVIGGGGERGVGGGSAGGGSSHEPNDLPALSEAGSSPIPNTNMHEAHKNHLNLSSSSPGRGGRSSTPRQAHEQLHHHHHHTPHHHTHHLGQRQDDMDIKQELVDYFHAPNVTGPAPPPPPESHLSYSSAGEERDMAQDLRVAQAKANFVNAFALPPSSASVASAASGAATAAMPLNMRKLTAATSAGHMLMTSLLNSRESVSDGDNDNDDLMNDEATESAASPGHIKSSVSAQDARAAAAALYAESLQRDDCDFIGSNVSLKLRTMDRTQRIIAEKLISEVLYYGQFNELERTARIQPK